METETGVLISCEVQQYVAERTASTWADGRAWADADGVYVYINHQDTDAVSGLQQDLKSVQLDVTETLLVDASDTRLDTDANCVVRVRVERMDGFDPNDLTGM